MVTSIMKKRTIRERKKNRRQTIAVWITTCIATALFAAVFSFASSCQAGLIEYAKDLSGDYDYVFYDVPREEADHIVNNRKVATAYQSVGLGYAKLSGSKNPDKPYVYLTAMDNRAMQKNALHLIKGRMPKNDHEILLSRHMMTNGGVEYRVGDTITLDISEREDKNGNVLTQSSGYRTGEKLKKKLTASFQVVGIVQRPNFGFEEWTAPGYSVITYLNPKGDNILEKYMQRTDIYCKYTKAGLRDRAQTTADLSGDYDYVFYDVPREEADHIVNNRKVATAYQSVGLGYAKLSGSKNPDKPYVYLTAMDNRAMQKNALHLIKGRMPKNDHEILLSRHMMTNGGVEYRVGDTITLDISEREDKNGNVLTQSSGYRTGEKLKKKLTASFQVVGIVQRPNFGFEEWTAPGYSVITYLNPKGDNILEKYMQRTDIYCKYTKAGLRDRAQTTADIVGVTLTPGVQKFPFIKDERITNRQINDLMERSLYRFYENWGLIRFERMDIGQSAYHMLYLAVAVTNVIILAAAVSCIGSSFAISMEEKRKSYGMLASVGATPRQIRQSVYYEAFLTGRTAIPLGTVLGLLLSTGGIFAIKALLYGQNTVQYLHVHVAWQMLIAGILLSTVTLVLSARRPAKQAAKSSPVAAMRGQAKKSRRAKKRTITAAIAGCTALFILVSYFMGVQTISVGQSNHMFDDHANVSVDVQGSWEVNRSAVLQSTKEKSVTEAAVLRTAAYMVNTKEVPYTQTHIRRNGAPDLKHETTAVIQVLAVGETAYRNYLKELGLSYETAKDCAIFYNAYAGYWDGKETTWKVTDYKPGDWIRGQFCREEQMEKTPDMTDQMQIAAVTTRRPFGVDTSQSYTDSGTIIVSDAWLDAHDPQGGAKITVKYASTDPGTLTQALEKTYDFYPEEIRNRDLQNRENNMLLFVDGIALYGFLLAVLLIGVTNICNTVLTDLWQRRQEFVILRSVGMTPKQEKQMLAKEFFGYGRNGIAIGLVIGGCASALYYRIFASGVQGALWFCVAATVVIMVGLLLLFAGMIRYAMMKNKDINTF